MLKKNLPRVSSKASLNNFLSAVLILAAATYSLILIGGVQQNKDRMLKDCVNQGEKCYYETLANTSYYSGVDVAFADLRSNYDSDPFVQALCHQLGHIIGRTAYEKYKNLDEVFPRGDSFCWSGYYHGAIEQVIGDLGKEELVSQSNQVCASFESQEIYSFDHYNCVHGLGHGFMAAEGYDLLASLKDCDTITLSWSKQSCYGGVYMESVMLEARENGDSKYLRDDEPLFPCTWVDTAYKEQCYLMQTSHILAHNGYDFEDAFVQCAKADSAFIETCELSIGRDASGGSTSNVAKTHERCHKTDNPSSIRNCMIGAAKDFVAYFHSDVQAKELCVAFKEPLTNTCLAVVKEYYASF